MLTLITSMNLKLYHAYGSNFLSSWKINSAPDIQLIVMFEGEGKEIVANSHQSDLIIIDSIQSDLFLLFNSKFSQFKEAHGLVEKNSKFIYNYRYDAIRFAFKIFSIYKAIANGLVNDDFGWLDSDIICKRNFSAADLKQFFPEPNSIASYLGRNNFPKPNAYSECGFVGYNYLNASTTEFILDFINFYMNGDIFTLKEWHDCFVFDHLRHKYESQGGLFKNLSEDLINEDHPFVLTGLGNYFDHLKGPERKIRGYS